MARFKSAACYAQFSREVRLQRRYVRTADADDFLRAVALTCRSRIKECPAGKIFWRAQLGNGWETQEDGDRSAPICYQPSRMKPLPNSANEGRANPKGIPYLYLSTTAKAAMSEVRPWVGSLISVARFATLRPLKIVDCSVLHGQYYKLLLGGRPIDQKLHDEQIDDVVWAAIDRAFSEPVTKNDDSADYAPTQTIAELFCHEGYDGIAYKSAFGEDAYTMALFNLESAEQLDGQLYTARQLDFMFEQEGNPYFVRRK
ncbi:RES family NAD+ phosphorylase [Bradyrhizobium sp.]|uniref:RES family NAD+ phosphorylase n=1 Tax=Bradyrhizobium sp. TaxID=376 RepID=UPI003C7177E0